MSDTLHLTLYRKWFDDIKRGIKLNEFRKATDYWRKRLEGRTYKYIRFVNGYGKHRPYIVAEFDNVVLSGDTFVIRIGKILEVGND